MSNTQAPVSINFNLNRMKVLEKIKIEGLEIQNQQLIDLGLTNFSQNFKYLKEYQGDFKNASTKLLEKKAKKEKSKDSDTKEKKQKKQVKEKKEKIPKEKREKREKVVQIPLKEFTEWPAEITTVYLDGNNMLFVDDAIRKKVLRRKRKAGEIMLASLAIQFSKLSKAFDVILIFDSTKLTYNLPLQVDEKTMKFDVVSAIPTYPDSDDALVHWSEGLGEKRNNCLFVTSDRGLQARLSKNGIENIMKPKTWFGFVKNKLGEENYNKILKKETKDEDEKKEEDIEC